MKIAIIGPGAVGTFLACELRSDHEIYLLGRSRIEETREMWANGIDYAAIGSTNAPRQVRRKTLSVENLSDAPNISPDLVFVTVRSDGLTEDLARTIVAMAPKTGVVILSNGIMPIDQSFDGIKGIENVVKFKQTLEQNNLMHVWGSAGASCKLSPDESLLAVSNRHKGITIYPSAYSTDEDYNNLAAEVEKTGVFVQRFSREKAIRAMFEKLSFTSAALSAIFGFMIEELATQPSAQKLLHKTAETFYKIAEENGVSHLGGKTTPSGYADWIIEQNKNLGKNPYAMWTALSKGKNTEIGACIEALCDLTTNIAHVRLFKNAARAITAMEICVRGTHPSERLEETKRLNQLNQETLEQKKESPANEIMRHVALNMEKEKKAALEIKGQQKPKEIILYPQRSQIIRYYRAYGSRHLDNE